MEVNVTDAKRQAAKNGLTNCEFIEGALDDLLPELQEKLKGEKVIPILDPPRAGISKSLCSCHNLYVCILLKESDIMGCK